MNAVSPPDNQERAVLAEVLQALRQVRFGQVQIIVRGGRVVQIDTTEKRRFDRPPELRRL